MANDLFFEVSTSLGFKVRVTRNYWELIATVKHPVMRGREVDVQGVLQTPDEIRQSRSDPAVFLFYRLEQPGRWLCAVPNDLMAKASSSRPTPPMPLKKVNEYGAGKGFP